MMTSPISSALSQFTATSAVIPEEIDLSSAVIRWVGGWGWGGHFERTRLDVRVGGSPLSLLFTITNGTSIRKYIQCCIENWEHI